MSRMGQPEFLPPGPCAIRPSEPRPACSRNGGANASVESLTLTYSDLGNVIQVKVNYTNGGEQHHPPAEH